MKLLKQIKKLEGKRILMRVDFNVGLDKTGHINAENALKIEKTLPTIKYLVKNKAKVILMAHLGRPGGKVLEELKLDAVAEYVSNCLKKKIKKINQIVGVEAQKEVSKLKNGQILLLENLRFDIREEKNDKSFAKELAKLGVVYVNEAFAVTHRKATSVCAITEFLPSYAGFLLEEEVKALGYILNSPKKPIVVVMGGLKFETKMPVIKKMLPKANHILLGGGLAVTVAAALGYKVGATEIGKESFKDALAIVKNKKVKMPIDFIAGLANGEEAHYVVIPKKPGILCKKPQSIFDIGPATFQEWSKIIKEANTIVWNGPMGFFEQESYAHASCSIAYLVASRSKGKAYGIVGGGETLAALEKTQMTKYIDHVSTGGGAMLEFMSGKKLPGLISLGYKK